MSDPDVVRYALGDLDRVLALSSDPLLRFQKVALSPADGYVLSRVDGTLSAREVMQMIPLPVEETQKSLFGLLCTGIIEYPPDGAQEGEAGGRRPPARWARPALHPPLAARPRRRHPRAATGSAAAPAPTAGARPPRRPPGRPATSPAMDGRRRRSPDAFEGLKTRNHFEVLGIEPLRHRAAGQGGVLPPGPALPSRHPPRPRPGRPARQAGGRLHPAGRGLRDPQEPAPARRLRGREPRARPDAAASGGAPGVPEAAAHAGSALPTPRPRTEGGRRRRAQGAPGCFEKEKYWDAIQLLEPAIEVARGQGAGPRRAWCWRKAYLKNPNWVKRAEETLLAIVHDDGSSIARSTDAHEPTTCWARSTASAASRPRATSMFRKVLELEARPRGGPGRGGPARRRSGEPAPETGGFFGKLFRQGLGRGVLDRTCSCWPLSPWRRGRGPTSSPDERRPHQRSHRVQGAKNPAPADPLRACSPSRSTRSSGCVARTAPRRC